MAKIKQASDKVKKDYWKKRMNEKLEAGYQAALPYLQDVAKMAQFQGIDKEDLEAGIVEIGDGFNTLKDLIDGKRVPFKIKIRKPEEKKL